MKVNVLILLAVLASTLAAQEVPTEPILMIHTEMHSSRVDRVDSDEDGRYLLTGSNDRTARLWDASSGDLLRIFRSPVGPGNEGKLGPVALTPDGELALAGYWLRFDQAGHQILAFDTMTGELSHRIGPFDNVILDMEFSPDGRYLAVAVWGTNGVAIVDSQSWEIIRVLGGYGDSSYNLDWNAQGELFTVSYDGHIRKYSPSFELSAIQKTSGGTRIFGMALSPDGRWIAVGFSDSNRIQVYSQKNLLAAWEPSNEGISSGNSVYSLAWSQDSQKLLVGGSDDQKFDDQWYYYVRIFENQGKGSHRDIPIAGNSILEMKTLPTGNIAYVTYNPDVGIIRDDGSLLWGLEPKVLGLNRRDRSHFRVSADGTEVGFQPLGQAPLTFSLIDRSLRESQSQAPTYTDQVRKMTVTDWQSTYSPLLNGRPLEVLDDYEQSRSVDISSDARQILLGTSWSLKLLKANGEEIWNSNVPEVAWAVNIAEDAGMAVVAYGDGTIRWHRLSDGQEVLALFVNQDRRRWVLWTPEGYYDASPGAESLVGWHVNRGLDRAPVFYPAGQFRDRFYRPEVIRYVLEVGNITEALAKAGENRRSQEPAVSILDKLPPSVTIVSPRGGQGYRDGNLTLGIKLDTPGDAPVQEIIVLANGRPINTARGLSVEAMEDVRSIPLNIGHLPKGEVILEVIAINANGSSAPDQIKIEYLGQEEFAEFVPLPKLYVLAIGVSDYQDSSLNLRYAGKDAEDIVATLKKQEGRLYREVNAKVITDEEGTRDNIFDGLEWLERSVTSNDLAILFIAGHGLNDNNGTLYYLPHEVNPQRLRSTGFPSDEFVRTVRNLPGKVLTFMDTCHSGSIDLGRRSVAANDINGVINTLAASENGAVVFASSAGNQFSLESPEWGNGAFTKALIEAFEGQGDYTRDGLVSINEINLYVGERVKELTGGQQTPVLQKPDSIRDFPLVQSSR
jgi:hypothetical protein